MFAFDTCTAPRSKSLKLVSFAYKHVLSFLKKARLYTCEWTQNKVYEFFSKKIFYNRNSKQNLVKGEKQTRSGAV